MVVAALLVVGSLSFPFLDPAACFFFILASLFIFQRALVSERMSCIAQF